MTALDSNILIGLWNEDDALNQQAKAALEQASERGKLVIAAPVYLEIRAVPGRTEAKIDAFLARAGITVDWKLEERIWREAARASHDYIGRRTGDARKTRFPRRIAADFIIGAHAAIRGYTLLTFDKRTFRIAFPTLQLAYVR